LRNIIKEVHVNFKEHVNKYRSEKLSKNDEELNKIFNAEVFNGNDALKLG
jgi:ClpP class serine protease